MLLFFNSKFGVPICAWKSTYWLWNVIFQKYCTKLHAMNRNQTKHLALKQKSSHAFLYIVTNLKTSVPQIIVKKSSVTILSIKVDKFSESISNLITMSLSVYDINNTCYLPLWGRKKLQPSLLLTSNIQFSHLHFVIIRASMHDCYCCLFSSNYTVLKCSSKLSSKIISWNKIIEELIVPHASNTPPCQGVCSAPLKYTEHEANCHFPGNIFKSIFLMKTFTFYIKSQWNMFLNGPIVETSALVQVMAWCPQATSHKLNQC